MRFPPPTTTTKTDDWSTIDKTHTRKAQFHCRILTLYDLIFWLTYCSLLITLINYQLRQLRVIACSLTFNAAVSALFMHLCSAVLTIAVPSSLVTRRFGWRNCRGDSTGPRRDLLASSRRLTSRPTYPNICGIHFCHA